LSLDDYKKANKKAPFHLSSDRYGRGQKILNCKKCKDTAFELLDQGKETGKCCRCGEIVA